MSALDSADLLVAVDVSDTTMAATGTDKKLTIAQLRTINVAAAQVNTSETQAASTAYADLATPGPAVTINTGTSVLVILTCNATKGTSGNTAFMGFAVSGATTAAASDAQAAHAQGIGAGDSTLSRAVLVTGLTAGTNTFTAKYHNDGGATWTFLYRTICVIPLN